MSVRFGCVAALCAVGCVSAQTVRFQTNLGDIDVILAPESAPQTVQNFLSYMNKGAYNNSVFHRSVPGFVIQAGGFNYVNGGFQTTPQDPAVRNEPGISNTRGTIAMAKLGDNPNSATNQFFFNLGDNSANLNNQNGGFTVFGRIANQAGLETMDKIAAVPVPNPGPLPSPFDQIPLLNWRGGAIDESNLVIIKSVKNPDGGDPKIADDGITTLSAYGGFKEVAPGSYISIRGEFLAESTREWKISEFVNNNAPTSLDGVDVTIDSLSGYVSYVSPGEVRVQVPGSVLPGEPVRVVLKYRGRAVPPVMVPIVPLAGGLHAPPSHRVEGKQYVAANRANDGSPVTNGFLKDVPAAPAIPGEVLMFTGIGFGPADPPFTIIAGRPARDSTPLLNPVKFKIGGIEARVEFAGLRRGEVGIYEFRVVVPADVAGGDQKVEVTQGDDVVRQELWLPVRMSDAPAQ